MDQRDFKPEYACDLGKLVERGVSPTAFDCRQTPQRDSRQFCQVTLTKLEELIVAKQVRGETIETDRPVCDYVMELFREEAATLWESIGKKERK